MSKRSVSTPRARALRLRQTPAEKALWLQLANRRLAEVKFRRQHPIGSFIVDFVSLDRRVVIELDGGHHNDESNRQVDQVRTDELERRGYTVLRFWNNDVIGNMEGVLARITEALDGDQHRTSREQAE